MIDLQAVERLAADQASLKAAAGLVKPGKWSGAGASGDGVLIWGECAGSGANPYRVCADLRDFGAKCTCPSRKFPCKHALALLWLCAETVIAFQPGDTPVWVGEWLGRRRGGAKPPTEVVAPKDMAAARADEPLPNASDKREAASVRRAEDTERAVLAGLDALDDWIGDQLRLGLGPFLDDMRARCRRIGARLVDGKAQGLASRVDELPARLLTLPAGDRVRGATVELGRLVLLARAYRAAPADPELRRAVVVAETRDAVLADAAAPHVADVWEVLAERVRARRDGLVSHATWLLRLGSGPAPRFALLLDYTPASAGRRAGTWEPGERFAGELVFFPARRPLRALLIDRQRIETAPPWPGAPEPERALADWALDEPWAIERPV
ncbi:MAG TPA: SWIM zinc finger family protein, partial [Sphingomonas sp.]